MKSRRCDKDLKEEVEEFINEIRQNYDSYDLELRQSKSSTKLGGMPKWLIGLVSVIFAINIGNHFSPDVKRASAILFEKVKSCGIEISTDVPPILFVPKTTSLDKQLEDAVEEYYNIIHANEPSITGILNSLETPEIMLTGLQYKIKTKQSTVRKMKAYGTMDVSELYDVLRYTFVISDNFVEMVSRIIQTLHANNIVINKDYSSNYFCEGNTYKGFNGLFMYNKHLPIEIQFHTPESLRIKEITHKLYEESRILNPTNPRVCELSAMMDTYSSTIPNLSIKGFHCKRIPHPPCTLEAKGKNRRKKRRGTKKKKRRNKSLF